MHFLQTVRINFLMNFPQKRRDLNYKLSPQAKLMMRTRETLVMIRGVSWAAGRDVLLTSRDSNSLCVTRRDIWVCLRIKREFWKHATWRVFLGKRWIKKNILTSKTKCLHVGINKIISFSIEDYNYLIIWIVQIQNNIIK